MRKPSVFNNFFVLAPVSAAILTPAQHPLTGSGIGVPVSTEFRNFNRTAQNDTLCNAGSAQWSGFVNIANDRDMFYWYFESRHDPKTAPLVIWMNGWTEFANVVFVDQPIGVGFSAPHDPDLWAGDLMESGIDFTRFLDIFVQEAFPELEHRPIHLAAESFGGRYAPTYASMMRRRFASLILVDPLINWPRSLLGVYEHLCVPRPLTSGNRTFSAEACEQMKMGYAACEKSAAACDLTYDGETCLAAADTCQKIYDIFDNEVVPGGWSPYDDRRQCEVPPICGGMGMEQVGQYLNTEWVQQALGLNDFDFRPVNGDFSEKWSNLPDPYLPSTREIRRILDMKNTPVIVLNGMNDVGINWEGMTATLDSLIWSGHADYKLQPLTPWYYNHEGSKVKGGNSKRFGRLKLVNIDEAGHMSPHDQPAAASFVIKSWIDCWSRSTC
ncbi:hypothetical protein G7054_g5168 [Neopestalotiopsis clavispora]|nr:hypothetical protein G7054_g5168 [Neopestalotiopsis clavispora]